MIVKFSAEADDDRFAIWDYITEHAGVKKADEIDALFVASALNATKMPEAYKSGRIEGTREIVVTPKYILIYEFDAYILLVLRVLHTSRQWPT